MSDLEWDEQAEFMRRVGATEATWDVGGKLLHLVLTPQAQPGPAAQMRRFHEKTEKERAAAARAEAERRHAVLFASSSVRPRLTDMTPPNAVPRAVRAKKDAARGQEHDG